MIDCNTCIHNGVFRGHGPGSPCHTCGSVEGHYRNWVQEPDALIERKKMEWVERRDADYLVSRKGKVLGRVSQRSDSTYAAEAVYAHGGNHRDPLGDYISTNSARAAVEERVREVGLADDA